jgi:hypothetical protein
MPNSTATTSAISAINLPLPAIRQLSRPIRVHASGTFMAEHMVRPRSLKTEAKPAGPTREFCDPARLHGGKMPDLWDGVIGLLGVALGWWLAERTRISGERQARLARLHALRAEIEHCGELLKTFLKDEVKAPLYRLPTWAGDHALGPIATDGSLGEGQVRALLRYYTNIAEINRGLDRAGEAHSSGDTVKLDEEYGRLRGLKIPALISMERDGQPPLQESVERAIKGALEANQ